MPSLIVKLYSSFFKYHQKTLLQSLSKTHKSDPFGVTSRPQDSIVAGNPVFTDGVATKDIHLDPFSSLSLRIFLPETALSSSLDTSIKPELSPYGGYSPPPGKFQRKLPVMLQFHGGGFVSGSNESVGNDAFCRRIAKMCDVIVVAVGYRLAPESRYPAAFEDGITVLNWVAKQANLSECRRLGVQRRIFDSFGASMVEPWLAAHGDPSRCVLLGASSGANIADYVARKAVEAGKLFDPVKVVAQVLMYPFFIGTIPPMHSEVNQANSYIYDKTMCKLAWKLFLPENEFDLDHPAANPLLREKLPPPKHMIPTLIVVAENDCMRDRAIAYSEELRKVNVDAPLLEYKDTVHEFATLDALLQTQQAKVCAEDISLWVKKYISLRGHEFSY
ncbi:probable carboxylesterase 16 [Euphorbia lathyris]|uniref:probable carboxylesterase 16 n=1 Tax=Euphorbia lathyris TaxID=212925 RepID=UPI0033141D0E